MTVPVEILAQLAATAYRDASPTNRIDPPTGWTLVRATPEASPTFGTSFTGFSASAFRNASGEVVIAYTGTKDLKDWPAGNFPAATGYFSPQVVQAAKFYWDVKQQFGDNISFTGHSLGGGLASLMAIYFNRSATTFDAAPFEASAFGNVITAYSVAFAVLGISDPAWSQYVGSLAQLGQRELFELREANVAHVYVSNEILAALRFPTSHIVGAGKETVLDSGAASINGANPIQLHSMLLAWSMRASEDFAAQIRALPRLYGLMQEPGLFERPVAAEEQDFHILLMQRESATGMLTRFTNDLARISSGFAEASPVVSDALIAATMGYYYAKRGSAVDSSGHASMAVTGGLQFDLNPLQQGLAGGGGLKALAMLEAMVDMLSGAAEDYRANSGRERLTISNSAALAYSDTDGKHDVIIGSTNGDTISAGGGSDVLVGSGGNDTLDGGTGDDIVDAGAGNDVLIGGVGDDRLLGGIGADRYEFAPGHGSDTIEDTLGEGSIRLGSGESAPQLTGGSRLAENRWLSAEINGLRYGFTLMANGSGGQDLLISQGSSLDRITIPNWSQGQLGITLPDEALPPPPPTQQSIKGDLQPLDSDPATPGVQLAYDALGNVVVTAAAAAGRDDTLYDSAGNDRIQSGGGADFIDAFRGGDDWIEAGTGDDAVKVVSGANRVDLGAGKDVGIGGADDDRLYGGADEDRMDGSAGNDTLYGDGDADLIGGGSGSDLVYGGAGDDFIGTGWSTSHSAMTADVGFVVAAQGQDWIVQRAAAGGGLRIPLSHTLRDTPSTVNFAFGEGGNDVLFGNRGVDILDGGDDDDALYGLHGADRLVGGLGKDSLYGDGRPNAAGQLDALAAAEHGDDLLDGGSGDDQLIGGSREATPFGGGGICGLLSDWYRRHFATPPNDLRPSRNYRKSLP